MFSSEINSDSFILVKIGGNFFIWGNTNIRAISRKSSFDKGLYGEPIFHIQFEASIRIDVLGHQWT